MFKNLNAGAIGIRNLSLPETIALAQATGFDGIDFDIREAAALADAHGVDYVRDLFAQAGVRAGLWGLPVAWNQDRWQEDLAELPRLAALGVALGCSRTATWCPSWSDSRAFDENYQWHIERYRPIAAILRDHGCRLGIEFLGPRHLWASHPHRFITSMGEMLKLARDIGTGNVGLLLDAYHLYTSGDEIDALDALTAADVVVVHINGCRPPMSSSSTSTMRQRAFRARSRRIWCAVCRWRPASSIWSVSCASSPRWVMTAP